MIRNVTDRSFRFAAAAIVLASACLGWLAPAAAKPPAGRPNILFFVLDDVGIDQMKVFGYGGATAPPDAQHRCDRGRRRRLPQLLDDARVLAEPRADVRGPLSDAHQRARRDPLGRPRQLPGLPVRDDDAEGAAHARLPERALRQVPPDGLRRQSEGAYNNPLGYTAVHQLGWDYFAGWQDGAPHPIDTTAGGVAARRQLSLRLRAQHDGRVPQTARTPARAISSTRPARSLPERADSNTRARLPGARRHLRLQRPHAAPHRRRQSNFTLQNGYYVSQLVINRADGNATVAPRCPAPNDPSGASRGYRSIIESNHAIDWINTRSNTAPWMATVSYSSAHTPFQQAPASLLPAGSLPDERLQLPVERAGPARAQQPDDRGHGHGDRSGAGGNRRRESRARDGSADLRSASHRHDDRDPRRQRQRTRQA